MLRVVSMLSVSPSLENMSLVIDDNMPVCIVRVCGTVSVSCICPFASAGFISVPDFCTKTWCCLVPHNSFLPPRPPWSIVDISTWHCTRHGKSTLLRTKVCLVDTARAHFLRSAQLART
jgi:hypothetical protein